MKINKNIRPKGPLQAFVFLVLGVFISFQVNAQSLDIGLQYQQYPTGFLPGIQLEKFVGEKGSFLVRVGANIFDHRDLGVQDREEGSGFGFSLGYKHHFKSERKHWFLAVKNDFWWNEVDWTDTTTDPEIMGTTKITVLQPTAAVGYTFMLGESFFIAPSVAFGFEWNVKTEGAPTGEGAILLGGITVGLRI